MAITVTINSRPDPEQRTGPTIVCPHCKRVHRKGVVVCRQQQKAIDKQLASAFKDADKKK